MNRKTVAIVLGGIAALVFVFLLVLRFEFESPSLTAGPTPLFVGAATPVVLVAADRRSGLARIEAAVVQGDNRKELLAEKIAGNGWVGGVHQREIRLAIDARALALKQGPATLAVTLRDHSWWGPGGNVTRRELPLMIDTVPPRVDLLSVVNHLAPGGTGAFTWRLGEKATRTGVEVDGAFFPAVPQPAGGPDGFLALAALPLGLNAGTKIAVTATDEAGNVARRPIPFRLVARRYTRDQINLSDTFLSTKMPEFAAADPSMGDDPMAIFLKVNRDWRARDHGRLVEIAASGLPEKLWSGAFVQMKNTQTMATYAQQRTYIREGRAVDQQTHLGLDLASTAGAPVAAANSGQVAYAGDLGIYGQVVYLDHGQGLYSLYAHLSQIGVREGERVEKGQSVGASGQSGMAGGDHLHFSMLVRGTFVNPVEWLDQHWIDDNVANKVAFFSAAPAL